MSQFGFSNEFNPEEPAAYQQEQIDIFGVERLEATNGHEASLEEAENLRNAIFALCDDKEAGRHHGIPFRTFSPVGDAKFGLVLVTGTSGRTMGFGGFSNMDDALASIDYLRYEEQYMKRPGALIPKKYGVREGIFIDQSGRAMIQREIFSIKGDEAASMAIKPATSSETEQAMEALITAIKFEESQTN